MYFETNIEKVMELFFQKPTEGFQIREIVRITKLGNPTVTRILNKLKKLKLVKKTKAKIYPYYEANTENNIYKKLKINYTLLNLEELIKEISTKTRPNCIVLFGSSSKGEDTEKSDIDLFIQAERRPLDFKKIEKKLNREVNILFEPNIKKISKELLNNLSNGIVLYGFLEVLK